MFEIDRRTFIRTGSAAVAVAGTVSAAALAASPGAFRDQELEEIAALERALLDALAAHNAAIEAHEPLEYGPDCPEKEAAEDAQFAACAEHGEAEARLIAFKVVTLDGLLAKGCALHRTVDWACLQDAAPALVADIMRIVGGSHV